MSIFKGKTKGDAGEPTAAVKSAAPAFQAPKKKRKWEIGRASCRERVCQYV